MSETNDPTATEERKEKQTLTERIKQLTNSQNTLSTQDTQPIFPHTTTPPQMQCVICGNARVRPDPTGATCGQSKCLLEVGAIFVCKDEEIAKAEKEAEAERRVEAEAKAEESSFLELFKKIAKSLGLNEKDLPEDNDAILGNIIAEIGNVTAALAELEEAQNKRTDK